MVELRCNPDLTLRSFATLFPGTTLLFACALNLPHSYLLAKAFHTFKTWGMTWGEALFWSLRAGMLLALMEAGNLVFNGFVILDAAHLNLRWVSPTSRRRVPRPLPAVRLGQSYRRGARNSPRAA